MKKYLHIILSLVCMLAPFAQATAQQEQRAFFVHRNDGDFNVMFFSEVDSMVYSRIDVDSVLHEDFVTQEIWTSDTVVRIPVEAIDSVTFQTPDNVYTEDAKIMSTDFRDYILLVDSLDLYLSPSTPTDLWPAVGDKLVTTDRCEKLPGGFIGKVEKVEDIGTFIKIECSQLKIEDVFTRYYGLFNVRASTTDVTGKKKGPQRISADEMIDWTHDLGTFKLDVVDGVTIDNLFGFFDGSTGLDLSGSLNLPDMRIVGCFIYEQETGIYLSASVGGTYNAQVGWSVYGSISKDSEISVAPQVPIAPGVFLFGNVGIKFGIGGTISLGVNAELSGPYGFTFTYSDKSPANLPPKAIVRITDTKFDPFVVSGDITFNAGIFYELGIDLGTKDLAKVSVSHETGWQLRAGGSFGLTDLMEMKKDSKFYQIVHNGFEWSVTPYTQLGLNVKFPKLSYSKTLNMEYQAPLLTAKFVPTFSNVDYTVNDALSYTFKADVDDIVYPATPVGFRLVDEDNNILYNEYFVEDYCNAPLFPQSFPHYELEMKKPLQINKKYKLYPILKLFSNMEMLCLPATTIEVSAKPYTDGADVLSYDEVVCHGHVKDENNVADGCLVGILFSETLDNVHSGKMISATLSKDKTFSVKLSNLVDDTKYYYCAYLKSGSDFYYGDIKSFETPKVPDEAVDLGLSVLWAKYNVGANAEGEAGGLYGWADAAGTQTSISVMDANGTTWISPLYGGPNPPLSICGNPSYDIAARLWGNKWRMPSQAEMAELINNCTTEYEEVNGVPGMRFTSVINGNSIFMPGAGDRFGAEYRYGGEGFYWTGTSVPENKFNAYRMSFDGYGAYENNYPRYIGHSVRAVMPKEPANN